jgi:flavin reductase (DIM6/NTAB) family NADH-FMN oxidoreductase RutF
MLHRSRKTMQKAELTGRVSLYPMPVAILGVMTDEKPNFITIAWFNRFNGNPQIWGVGISKGKITLEAIEKHREFSINFREFHENRRID